MLIEHTKRKIVKDRYKLINLYEEVSKDNPIIIIK